MQVVMTLKTGNIQHEASGIVVLALGGKCCGGDNGRTRGGVAKMLGDVLPTGPLSSC